MTFNGRIINVARLKLLFKGRNALDNVQKLHVGYFWKHLDKYKKLNWYARLARLRNCGIYVFYAQSKRFFLNCAWRRRLIPYLPDLDTHRKCSASSAAIVDEDDT